MVPLKIVLGSPIGQTIQIFQEAAPIVPFEVIVEQKLEDFLLTIQEQSYHAMVFDLAMRADIDPVKTIRLIRQMRPKVPLIVVTTELDKKFGSQIMNEGVFHIITAPLNKETVHTAMLAILNAIKSEAAKRIT